ncbi:non-heme iron oxygenase ferredoxin subunit [Enemella sp. A6]|uniref:non-heme iron oxygenase ferredoxin subunit n=1 Tax=Enemella sp. A6 TaxID=3440152 RepID=UPI003EC105F1
MAEPILVGLLSELPEDEVLVVDADDAGTEDDIAVFHSDGVWAMTDLCSHGAAKLSEGWIENGLVECPLHGSEFCLRSGKPQTLPANVPVDTHRVEVRGDELWLHVGEPVTEND